ncbi:hypothetical protein ABZY44_24030 [Streptomyces sp. NPDC006544]|uniref:hypothetical protein n=1 Tax=Streptomyces sp. NPDC006544 TaxID=3154583 RepID=UPI0033BF52AA
MAVTTGYGSWYNVQGHELSAASTVRTAAGDYPDDYDLDEVETAYLVAIQEALPPGVYVNGLEFIGPYNDEDKNFDGYPADEYGDLDLTAIVESVDLMAILEERELIDINEVASRLGYKGQKPSATARKTLARWGVEAVTTRPHPESNRPQHLYSARQVEEAIKNRPGQGHRSDKVSA